MSLFSKKEKPRLAREEFLDAVVVPFEGVRSRLDDRGLTVLEVTFTRSPLAARLAKWFGSAARPFSIELDERGSFVWDLCDGRHTIRQMIALVSEHCELKPEEAEVILTEFIRTLGDKGVAAVVVHDEQS